MDGEAPQRHRGYQVLAWLVVLGGAAVRATGSGAGCGASRPRYQGQLIPADPGTVIAVLAPKASFLLRARVLHRVEQTA